MLIPISTLIQKYNLQIKGVIHVGASHAEEAESYLQCGIKKQLWVEAIPEVFDEMQKVISSNPDAIGINACVSDMPYKNVTFNVTNNAGQSSSFLPLKDHKKYHPDVVVERTIEMVTLRLDDIVASDVENPFFNTKNYNFLNLDIQGAELLALKGFQEGLKHIDYIYCEVNDEELYEGCPHVAEIDHFLLQHGFQAVECKMTECHWGDKFYMRK